jgi:uncharacterized protein (TIGR02284 family)
MTSLEEKLGALLTALIDSRNGYREGLKKADEAPIEGSPISLLFGDLIANRSDQIAALRPLVPTAAASDDTGSFMSTVHRTVIDVRALVTGLDDSILPGIIDGEERIARMYDEALPLAQRNSAVEPVLLKQRDAVRAKLDDLRRHAKAA